MKNIPKRIWLQIRSQDKDYDFNDKDKNPLPLVTWSEDQVHDTDIEYERTDLTTQERMDLAIDRLPKI